MIFLFAVHYTVNIAVYHVWGSRLYLQKLCIWIFCQTGVTIWLCIQIFSHLMLAGCWFRSLRACWTSDHSIKTGGCFLCCTGMVTSTVQRGRDISPPWSSMSVDVFASIGGMVRCASHSCRVAFRRGLLSAWASGTASSLWTCWGPSKWTWRVTRCYRWQTEVSLFIYFLLPACHYAPRGCWGTNLDLQLTLHLPRLAVGLSPWKREPGCQV